MSSSSYKNVHQWSPESFLISGRYCDQETIYKYIENIRDESMAEAALLICFHRQTFFQSLSIFSHKNSRLESQVQEKLNKAIMGYQGPFELHGVFPSASKIGSLEDVFPALVKIQYFSPLSDIFKPNTYTAALTKKTPQHFRMYLVLFQPGTKLKLHYLTKRMAGLVCMLHGSAPVDAHRTLWNIRRAEYDLGLLEARLHDSLPQTDIGDMSQIGFFPKIGKGIARIAATHAKCDALFYFFNSQGKLTLEATSRNQKNIRTYSIMANAVVERKLPLMWTSFARTNIGRPPSKHQPALYSLLAVPIVQASLTNAEKKRRKSMMLGAIVLVRRLKNNPRAFSPSDLAFARHLAVRICLIRARILAHLSTSSLHCLYDIAQNTTSLLRSSAKVTAEWPELKYALPYIKKALEQVYHITLSLSVTFRILNRENIKLTRVAAFPKHRLKDDHPVISIKDNISVNAWVARNGKECYLPDTKATNSYKIFQDLNGLKEARAHTRSEWCCPVIVSGRLIGTVNIESGILDGYSDSRPYLRAIVAQIGFSIHQARSVLEKEILSISSGMSLGVHELLHCRDKLTELLNTQQVIPSEICSLISSIDSSLAPGTTLAPRAPKTAQAISRNICDVRQLIKLLIADVNLQEWTELEYNKFEVLIPKTSLESWALAMLEVLTNTARMLSLCGGKLFVSSHVRKFAGKRFCVVSVQHMTTPPFYDELDRLSPLLYRQSIKKRDRIHVGALIAGALVRQMGGDIYVNFRKPHVETVVEIPIGTI